MRGFPARRHDATSPVGVLSTHSGQRPSAAIRTSYAFCARSVSSASADAPREHRAVDHETHLRVEMRRALVEVERADEDPLAVDRERLGVQLRPTSSTRASRLVVMFLDRSRRLELVELRRRRAGDRGGASRNPHAPDATSVAASELVSTRTLTPRLRQRRERRGAVVAGHEVGRDEVEQLFGPSHRRKQLREEQHVGASVACRASWPDRRARPRRSSIRAPGARRAARARAAVARTAST